MASSAAFLAFCLAVAWSPQTLPLLGNSRSMVYHWVGCPSAPMIAPGRRVVFRTPGEAEAAGYRPARNCPAPPQPRATGSPSVPQQPMRAP